MSVYDSLKFLRMVRMHTTMTYYLNNPTPPKYKTFSATPDHKFLS